MRRRLALCLALPALVACQPKTYLKPLPPLAPLANTELRKVFTFSPDARQVKLQTVVFDVPAGYAYGQESVGFGGGCGQAYQLVNTDGNFELDVKVYADVFTKAMVAHGYPVNTDLVLFQGSDEKTADLRIAAKVVDVALNYCTPHYDTERLKTRGNAYLKVSWSVFSNLEKKIVFTTVTEGSTYGDIDSAIGQRGILRAALADAAERLAVSETYRALVEAPAKPAAAVAGAGGAGGTRFKLKRTRAWVGDLKSHLELIRKAVATVTSNAGSGSGFAISEDGKMVTAAHVVAGSKFVKLKTGAGKECYGEVAATDARRDLALLIVDCGTLAALPFSLQPASEGSDVFSVGTPLSEKLEFSVTKGVVSSLRTIEGQTYVQSDVSVLPGNSGGPLLDASGNLLGVCSRGMSSNGTPLGLNFFVPATDIEKSLPIDFEAAP